MITMNAQAKRALDLLEELLIDKAERRKFYEVHQKIVDLLRDEMGDPLKAYLVLSFTRDVIKDHFHIEVTLKEQVFSRTAN